MNDTKKKSRLDFWISTSLAIFFFLCSIVLFFTLIGLLILKSAFLTDAKEEEVRRLAEIVIEGTGTNKITIIPVKGVITSQSSKKFLYEIPSVVDSLKKQLEQARNDNDVKAVILEIDSPGGGITASDIIYNEILDFKEKTKKKVIVSMQDIAASGAYYISVAADKIMSHQTTITGSIGVIMPLINIADLAEKYGVEDTSIKSGNMKDIGSPFKKISNEELEVLHGIVDEMYTKFLKVISEGRNMKIENVRKLADGRIYTGGQALDNGLVDKLGYIEDAITLAKEMAGLREAKIIKYRRTYTLAEIFSGKMNDLFVNPTIKIIDINALPVEDNFPRFMYLWMGYQKDYVFKYPKLN